MTHPFTPTYIAMAKAAEEIQAMRDQLERGDWFSIDQPLYGNDFGGVLRATRPNPTSRKAPEMEPGIYCVGDVTESGISENEWSWDLPEKNLYTWLPRLDQLLAMLETRRGFARSVAWYSAESDIHEIAIECVMEEKYGKTWRDGQWVKG